MVERRVLENGYMEWKIGVPKNFSILWDELDV